MKTVRRATAHTFLALLEAVLVASLLVLVVAGSAFAGKPSGGGGGGGHKTVSGGTISVTMVSDNDASGAISFGDVVRWDVSRTTVSNPYITTTCTQNGATALTTWAGYYPGYLWPAAQDITLSSDVWTGGAASCTGVLYGTSTKATFSVGG
jgi:hypothetical protein